MKMINRSSLVIGIVTSALMLALASPSAFSAKVYKWVDKDGNVHYGAQKPNTSAQEMRIKVNEPAPEEEPTATESKAKGKSESKEEKVKVSSEEEAREVEKKNEAIRKKNCNIAKKRLASINAGGRLYEVNEKGERKFWDDATKAGKRAQAEAQVAEWCK